MYGYGAVGGSVTIDVVKSWGCDEMGIVVLAEEDLHILKAPDDDEGDGAFLADDWNKPPTYYELLSQRTPIGHDRLVAVQRVRKGERVREPSAEKDVRRSVVQTCPICSSSIAIGKRQISARRSLLLSLLASLQEECRHGLCLAWKRGMLAVSSRRS